ncbi:TPA: TDT family transporter, partial [Mannheimia haemolytica]|nr:TDT family transporter [Mannheimia haemolytica]
SKPFPITTGFFAMPLGLGALGLAWLNATPITPYATTIGNIIAGTSVILWVALLGCYVYRVFFCFEQIKAEFMHPVQCCLFSLVTMTTMISGDVLYVWDFYLGELLIFLGVIVHLIFLVFIIGGLWKGTQFLPETLHPVHYLPPIAGSFTMASSLSLIGYSEIASLFLGIGIISWLVYEPTMLQRIRLSPLFPIARPSLGIVLAPAFVGASAYFSMGGELDLLAKMLWGYGFLQFCFILRNLKWIAENGFSMGFWAFSFGLAAMARGAIEFYQFEPLSFIGLAGFTIANFGIGLLLIFTLKLWLQQSRA